MSIKPPFEGEAKVEVAQSKKQARVALLPLVGFFALEAPKEAVHSDTTAVL
jgi:hypothetical protein